MKLVKYIILLNMLCVLVGCSVAKKSNRLTDYVNPFIGTATLWDSTELGYKPTRRAWGAEVYPGASLPNSMVQVTPVTMWRSGSGYQYEDTVIYAFVHTSKGHWNLCYVPFIGVSGEVEPKTYYSSYSHEHESASPGYYQVYLEKYDINAEVTSTLRCAYHKYTYKDGKNKKLLADLARSNEHVKDWKLEKRDNNVFIGYQKAGSTFYFYAVTNHKIRNIESLKDDETEVSVVNFLDNDDIAEPLELKVGFSYVSVENAKENLESEMLAKSFSQVRTEAEESWEKLLSKIRVIGGTEEEKEIIQEEKARKHKNKKADKRKVRTGGFVDEIDEEDVTGYSENGKKVAIQQTAQTAASEAHAELKKEIAAATSEEADMLSRLEMAERTVEENRKPHPAGKVEEVPEEEEEPVTIGSLAMPSYSAAQLASRVKKAGDAPDIVKDDITKVTLFDYSDIISGDVDDMEE